MSDNDEDFLRRFEEKFKERYQGPPKLVKQPLAESPTPASYTICRPKNWSDRAWRNCVAEIAAVLEAYKALYGDPDAPEPSGIIEAPADSVIGVIDLDNLAEMRKTIKAMSVVDFEGPGYDQVMEALKQAPTERPESPWGGRVDPATHQALNPDGTPALLLGLPIFFTEKLSQTRNAKPIQTALQASCLMSDDPDPEYDESPSDNRNWAVPDPTPAAEEVPNRTQAQIDEERKRYEAWMNKKGKR